MDQEIKKKTFEVKKETTGYRMDNRRLNKKHLVDVEKKEKH